MTGAAYEVFWLLDAAIADEVVDEAKEEEVWGKSSLLRFEIPAFLFLRLLCFEMTGAAYEVFWLLDAAIADKVVDEVKEEEVWAKSSMLRFEIPTFLFHRLLFFEMTGVNMSGQ